MIFENYFFQRTQILKHQLEEFETETEGFSKTYFYTDPSPLEFTFRPGRYRFECWGAQGKNGTSKGNIGGSGGYTSGELVIYHTLQLYFYIGSTPSDYYITAYNGGGYGQMGGGGATDVRLIKDDWDNFESLKSRIMVAAGGGGCDSGDGGGDGGGVNGFDSTKGNGKGATQIKGGNGQVEGKFGLGGGKSGHSNGGGGGGYYGGGSSTNSMDYGGGGGSSFISGYSKCNAIYNSSTSFSDIHHSGTPYHYSGLIFKNPQLIDGKSSMPSPYGGFGIGNQKNGAIRITFMSHIIITKIKYINQSFYCLAFTFMFIYHRK